MGAPGIDSGPAVPCPPAPPPGAVGDPAPGVPGITVQVLALQALCRQVFGFRMAVLALAAPIALTRVPRGLSAWITGSAAVVTFMGSYLLFRDWERFGPLLLRHPALLAVDTFFAAALLAVATTHSPLAYVTVSTPLLAGLVYGWRGSLLFTTLQVMVLGVVASLDGSRHTTLANALLLSGFCVIAGAVGVSLRRLMLRFGAATQALAETRSRLAVTEAVGGERARLAREMHDSVAKTLHGVALAAEALAAGAGRLDPGEVRRQADVVARSARRAAAETRDMLGELRRESGDYGDPAAGGEDAGPGLTARLADCAADFERRTGLPAEVRPLGPAPLPPVPRAVARQLVSITAEALENAHRHAGAGRVRVEVGIAERVLRVAVVDDGRGLPAGLSLDDLRGGGHFGVVGMVERAGAIGARLRIGPGPGGTGTEVCLELPVAALVPHLPPSPGPDGPPGGPA